MDSAVKKGVVFGFLALAVIAAVVAWRQEWLPGGARRPSPPEVAVAPNTAAPKAPDKTPETPSPAQPPPAAKPNDDKAPAAANPPPPGDVAVAPPAAAPKPPAAGSSAGKGAFDVVRVEPSGDMVVAGRCTADCTAELTANGKTQEKVKADAAGNFAMVPPPLAPGDHQLGLKITTPDGKVSTSEQTVTVSVPKGPSKEVVVVLNEPDAPSKVLQNPGQAPAAAARPGGPAAPEADVAARQPEPGTPDGAKTPAQKVAALSLGAVDAENGRFFVQGTAPAGAKLKVYLNNALVAEPVAGADERWSLRVERGLSPGKYVARVDQIGSDGKVATRAEQAFAYEAAVAAAEPKVEPQPQPPQNPEPQPQTDPAVGGEADATPAAPPQLNKEPGPQRPDAPPPAASGVGSPKSAETAPGSGDDSAESPRDDGPSGAAARQGSGPASPDAAAPPGASAATSPPTTGGSTQGETPPSAPSSSGAVAATPTPQPRPDEAPSRDARTMQPDAAPNVSDPANPVVASIDTAQVSHGDSLWRISRKTYGRGMRYTAIFTANDDQIRNPNLIYPGQVLVLPADEADGRSAAPR